MQKLNYHALFLFVFFLAIFAKGNAQTRTTVLLNNTNSDTRFIYDLNQLPNNLTISQDSVLLKLNIRLNNLESKQFQYLTILKNNIAVGITDQILRSTNKLFFPLDLHQELPKLKDKLELTSKFSEAYIQNKIFFYNSFLDAPGYEINKQPKLVINYEVTREPSYSDWEQANANAQHTNTINWKWEGNFNETYFNNQSCALTNCISDKTIIYKEKPIVFERTGGCEMSLLNYSNNRKLWTLDIGSIPSKYPLIDKKGNIYLFLSNNKLKVVDLENHQIIKDISVSELKFKFDSQTEVTINSINGNPTIGYDGTIYVPINNTKSRVGIVALSAYPYFKPRWFYNTTNPVSSIALSENEKYACFIEVDPGSKKSRLVVLDNISGEIFAVSEDVLSSYENDGNFYFPPVVTQKITDSDKTNIYIIDGNKTAKKLFVFQIDHNMDNALNNTIKMVKMIESSKKEVATNTGISQLVVTPIGSVFFIKDNVLSKFDTNSNETTSLTSSITFDNESEIIANATNQLIITSNKGLYCVDANTASPKVTNVYNFSPNNEPYKNLLTANFGIYRFTSSKCEFIKPTFSGSGAPQLELSEFKNKTVYFYKATTIKNGTTINGNTNTILVANTIQIKKNFTIKKGANVSFKIN